MDLDQAQLTAAGAWHCVRDEGVGASADLVLAFGARAHLGAATYRTLRDRYPAATIAMASTAGNILDTDVSDAWLSVTALRSDHTEVHATQVPLDGVSDTAEAGRLVAARLRAHATAERPLVHVLILSDGQDVEASYLVAGLNAALPAGVTLSGGLAGDGDRFEQTLVGLNAPPAPGVIAGLGFYGTALQVRCGSAGGWAPFGPARIVTRASGPHLHELDGEPALALYRRYLGPFADGLPAAALRFPLELTVEGEEPVVRTILHLDEETGTMTFAGSIPAGARVRLMRSSYEDLVDGAIDAAQETGMGPDEAEFALCISCVGRRIVLGLRVEDETEGVRDLLGSTVAMAGFYSYGELGPGLSGGPCTLHNQTMTLTLFAERPTT